MNFSLIPAELRDIAAKVEAGTRITEAEALELFATPEDFIALLIGATLRGGEHLHAVTTEREEQ